MFFTAFELQPTLITNVLIYNHLSGLRVYPRRSWFKWLTKFQWAMHWNGLLFLKLAESLRLYLIFSQPTLCMFDVWRPKLPCRSSLVGHQHHYPIQSSNISIWWLLLQKWTRRKSKTGREVHLYVVWTPKFKQTNIAQFILATANWAQTVAFHPK